MINTWPQRNPFSGAQVAITEPIGGWHFIPKLWSIHGYNILGLNFLHDDTVNFVTAGIVPADVLYGTDPAPNKQFSALVVEVIDPHTLLITQMLMPETYDITYKVGKLAEHTLSTLAAIIDARGSHSYTILYSTLWCTAPIANFLTNQYGDVYCIY